MLIRFTGTALFQNKICHHMGLKLCIQSDMDTVLTDLDPLPKKNVFKVAFYVGFQPSQILVSSSSIC